MEPLSGIEPEQAPYQGARLPLHQSGMERVVGLEPTSSAWKAEALPLDDTRMSVLVTPPNGGTL